MSKALDKSVQKFMQDPENPEWIKDGLNTLFTSRLASGQKYEHMGMLEEAIAEYAKEYERPIKTKIDAEIVQKAHCQTGEVYQKFGQTDKAYAFFQKARELLNTNGVGTSPHKDLADILIEQGQIDEAVKVLEEYVQKSPLDSYMARVLLEAREKRDTGSNHSEG
jgi:tetratricopeptide (TPR) repeat protein